MIYIVGNKGESQNECFKKTKHAKFFEKWTFLTHWQTHEESSQGSQVFDSFIKLYALYMKFFLNWQKQMIMSDLQIKCLWKVNVLELAKINK